MHYSAFEDGKINPKWQFSVVRGDSGLFSSILAFRRKYDDRGILSELNVAVTKVESPSG